LWQGNVFKIYVTEGGLYFARVTDRLYPEALGKKLISPLVFGVGGLVAKHAITQPAIRKQMEQEEIYDQLDPSSSEFLSQDKRNLSVTLDAQADLTLVKATGMSKSVTQIGFLELQENGKKRRFTLAGSLPSDEIEELIRKAFANIKGTLR
jgi:hypothetical protein